MLFFTGKWGSDAHGPSRAGEGVFAGIKDFEELEKNPLHREPRGRLLRSRATILLTYLSDGGTLKARRAGK